MSVSALPEHLKDAGRKLLAALDEAGLGAEGAGWIFFHHLEEWRFVVATSLVESIGRTTVYRMLLAAMENLVVPNDLTVEDVHLISTESADYKTICGLIQMGGGTAIFKDCQINDVKFDAVLYRWGMKPPTKEEMRKVEKTFKRRVKELSG